MEPFFFGEHRDLFGAYYMAQGMPRRHGVLIAGPLLNEGIRAQFALRRIAERLSARGYDVLRFDYKGLGNSPVPSSHARIADWAANIVTAADELPAIAGVETGTLIAVRFGACLAADLMRKRRLQRLLLWDPILDGARWTDDLRACRENLPIRLRDAVRSNEFMGHEMHEGFAEELETRRSLSVSADEVAVVLSSGYRHSSDIEKLTEQIDKTQYDCQWTSYNSSVIYSADIIEAICNRTT